ncbi:DUF5994 family protein [Nocardia sp. NPDC005745]|uniref:DUF5994 family protein n=1 Tax=Nocardia sp. NPDC005745 TaxID=3157061 RepID=UPI0033ED6CA8
MAHAPAPLDGRPHRRPARAPECRPAGLNAISLAQRRIDDDDGIRIHSPVTGQPSDTMRLVGRNGTSLTLLVIPADTEPRIADRRMRQAAGQAADRESSTGAPHRDIQDGERTRS